MRNPAPRIPVKDQQTAETIVQQYGPSLLPGTTFVLPDGKVLTYNGPTGQQPARSPGMTTQAPPQAAPDRNTNNPINLGQQYYGNLSELYDAQTRFQEEALKQFIAEGAAGNPDLASMMGMLQYSMNEDQLPLPERQALNAQREMNRQQALRKAGIDDHAQVQLRHRVNDQWNSAFDQQQAAGTVPGGTSLADRGHMETANIPLLLQHLQEQNVNNQRIARNAATAEQNRQNMRLTTPYTNAQGTVDLGRWQGRTRVGPSVDLNNIGPNGERTNTYKP